MSLFRLARPATEERSYFPPVDVSHLLGNYASLNPADGNAALASVAFHATAHTIASLAAGLPVFTLRNGRRTNSVPDNLRSPGGDGKSRRDWGYRLMMSLLVRANAYGFETSWNSRGTAMTVDLVHPDDVRAQPDGAGSVDWYVKGRKLEGDDRRHFRHWRAFPEAGRVLGPSLVERHATTLGISLRSARFGEQWFTDGAHPSGILANSKELRKGAAETAKARFLAALRGSREPVVLGGDWSWKPIQLNPEESQFIETQRWSEAQAARLFGPGWAEIMGYESGGSMTYANVADRRQDLLVLSMNSWLLIYEEILTELQPPGTVEVQATRDALLQATTLQRYQAHESALKNRWRTVNEIRAIEDLEPVAWGDQPNTTTTQPMGASNADPA